MADPSMIVKEKRNPRKINWDSNQKDLEISVQTISEYPEFLWQREYNKKWTNYSTEECRLLNKAFTKNKKTLTLPSNDSRKKLNINFEKMCQKNIKSGYEQRVRCLVYNDGDNFSWSWKDDFGYLTSYMPRVVLYLEVAFKKKLDKVDLVLKDEYEIDLNQFTQRNKVTNNTREILRERIQVNLSNTADCGIILKWNVKCDRMVAHLSTQDEQSIKNILYDLPVTRMETQTSDLQIPVVSSEIISTAQASTSTASPPSVSVDPLCPDAKKCHVYFDGSNSYHATLNFANVQDNNNKFYNIQLLEYDKQNKYAVWLHWGRVGYNGQTSFTQFNKNLTEAKLTFEKKFYDKTRNHFKDIQNFQRVQNKYDLVDTDLSNQVVEQHPTAETTLDKRIQDLLEIICNKKTLEEAAKEMSYDSKATPLGKITSKQLQEGYIALNNISKILKTKGVGKDLIEACNIFYTKIPHDFGRKPPKMLYNMDDVKEKLKMLETLSNICLAMDVIGSNQGLENPIDKYYKSLECTLIPLEHDSEEFQALYKCLKDTHGPSHHFSLEIIDAYKCIKECQEDSFINYGNNKLLWHGSRISNWISILKKGLRIAPPEAPSSGYMFGKGVYFADVSSKSANYCFATKKQNEGLLQLSEVSLGNSMEVYQAADLSNLPNEFQSVSAVGKFTPSSYEKNALSSEALVPCGPLEERIEENFSLIYNEYVVYNVHQIKMKYLMRIRFIF